MATTLSIPDPGSLAGLVETLRGWHRQGGPFHLHPGDLGWLHLHGAETVASRLRIWRREGRVAALGMLDGPALVRTAIDPALVGDAQLARDIAESLADPAGGVLPAGPASVEAHSALQLRTELESRGWSEGERWVPLRRDLAAPVPDVDLAVEEVAPDTVSEYTAVHRSAFSSPGVTDERFRTMIQGPAHREAASLLGRDPDGTAVAVITVWSAGPGRPGLIEPMGVHGEHRGRGHGREICLAGAARLRAMGASSALVCTAREHSGAVETYVAAGFMAGSEVPDLERGPAA